LEGHLGLALGRIGSRPSCSIDFARDARRNTPTRLATQRLVTVTVLLFASYADALGHQAIELPLGERATVADVVRLLGALPGAAGLPPRPLVAVNAVYATYDREVRAGDEVAVIPPVAGG
jgi:sulfur-carrier protein